VSSEGKETLLIEKIREGDEYAFEIAFLKYYTPLCRYIWKYVRSKDLAEEVVQEVFAAIWEMRDGLDANGHLKGLLYETGRNKALNYIKHQKIVSKYLSEAKKQNSHKPYSYEDNLDPDDHAFFQAARNAIDNLPPKASRIYKLNQHEGLTYKEIAGYLGISVRTVESQMRRSLQILRECLSEYLPVFIVIGLSLLLN